MRQPPRPMTPPTPAARVRDGHRSRGDVRCHRRPTTTQNPPAFVMACEPRRAGDRRRQLAGIRRETTRRRAFASASLPAAQPALRRLRCSEAQRPLPVPEHGSRSQVEVVAGLLLRAHLERAKIGVHRAIVVGCKCKRCGQVAGKYLASARRERASVITKPPPLKHILSFAATCPPFRNRRDASDAPIRTRAYAPQDFRED